MIFCTYHQKKMRISLKRVIEYPYNENRRNEHG